MDSVQASSFADAVLNAQYVPHPWNLPAFAVWLPPACVSRTKYSKRRERKA